MSSIAKTKSSESTRRFPQMRRSPIDEGGIARPSRTFCAPITNATGDKILHTKAFRRLSHKTQVFLAAEGDHFRTRLTHTLEVAQIARTIARSLGLNEDLTEAISLGHDLGHRRSGIRESRPWRAALPATRASIRRLLRQRRCTGTTSRACAWSGASKTAGRA